MTNFIILIVFLGILIEAISIALGIYLATEKGKKLRVGLIFGILPLVGHLLIALMITEDIAIAEEAFSRQLISEKEFENTKEIIIKKK